MFDKFINGMYTVLVLMIFVVGKVVLEELSRGK